MIILNTIVFCNILIIALLLILRKNNPLPNIVLALIFITPGLNFINNINILSGNIYNFPWIYFIVQATVSVFAPLFYWYIQIIINEKIFKRIWLFILSAITFSISIFILFEFILMNKAEQIIYLESLTGDNYPKNMEFVNNISFLLQLIYASFAVYDIWKFKQKARKSLSSIGETKIKILEYFISIIWVLTLLTLVLYETLPTIIVEYIALPIIVFVILLFILYYAFNFNTIFTEKSYQLLIDNTVSINEINDEIELNKQSTYSISNENISSIEIAIHSKKLFTKPDLTLNSLAKEVNLPAHIVSKIINQHLNTNFYDLINSARVNHAKELITKFNEQFTMEAIAQEVGFNSRASFYRAFKKFTGKTPTEYLNSQKP